MQVKGASSDSDLVNLLVRAGYTQNSLHEQVDQLLQDKTILQIDFDTLDRNSQVWKSQAEDIAENRRKLQEEERRLHQRSEQLIKDQLALCE